VTTEDEKQESNRQQKMSSTCGKDCAAI